VCLDELRRRRRRDLALGAFYALAELRMVQDPAEKQANGVARDELLACLTKTERRVIGCTVLDDRSHVEAAAQLGISASTSTDRRLSRLDCSESCNRVGETQTSQPQRRKRLWAPER